MTVSRALLGECEAIYPTLEPGYTLIVSDGAYGIDGFPGDPTSARALAGWYAPHLEAWDRLAAPSSSLYFWGTPEGCARMLAPLEAAGWTRSSRIVWSKGTGRADLGGIRKWPEHFSEECWVYTREAVDISALAARGVTTASDLTHRSIIEAAGADERNTVRAFLRDEWMGRAGLRVADAVAAWRTTAPHFFSRSQWEIPTWEAFAALASAASAAVPLAATDRPYFVVRAVWERRGGLRESYEALRADYEALRESYEALRADYEALRYPFALPAGAIDVWTAPPVQRTDRHACAKRDDHIETIVRASSRPGDRVLEPFGGGAPVLRACRKLGRSCDSIERDPDWHRRALAALRTAPELAATADQPSLFG